MDDQPEVARALSLPLCRLCKVIQAYTAEQGAVLLSEDLTAVLTDYDMPGRNGIWLLSQARERFPQVFRALISGNPPDNLDQHIASGVVQSFAMKPDLPDALLALLREQEGIVVGE